MLIPVWPTNTHRITHAVFHQRLIYFSNAILLILQLFHAYQGVNCKRMYMIAVINTCTWLFFVMERYVPICVFAYLWFELSHTHNGIYILYIYIHLYIYIYIWPNRLEHSAWIQRWGVWVPLRSKRNWQFHKNTRSCVENECCCPRTVKISNVNFTSKISIPPEPVLKNTGQQMSGPDSSIG